MFVPNVIVRRRHIPNPTHFFITANLYQVAQDIIGDLRSLLTEVNYAGTVLAQAAKAYAVPAPPGVIGLQSDPDDPKRLLRIS